MRGRVWSVGDLIREVNSLLEAGFSGVRVEGEVTNVSQSGRGHLYFSLKDESAAVDCVMWSSRVRRLKFRAEDGLAVLAVGSLTVYPQRGRFQLVVDDLQPQGLGALQLAFEQLKKRLAAEGLFATERKRELPALPQRVGVVTSLTGAALRDMLKVLRRFPHLEVVVADARVQGEGAAAEIADGLQRLAASKLVDVVVLARGGGSLEDLWAFNEEEVARAIATSPLPVVSAVGHEVDFTIADFVADVRAATPTQAAELVVARLEEQVRRLRELESGLARDLRRHLQLARTRLHGVEGSSGLAAVPQRLRLVRAQVDRALRLPALLRRLLDRSRARLGAVDAGLSRLPHRVAAGGHRRLVLSRTEQMVQLMGARVERVRAAIDGAERGLAHLSPTRVLERGYSVTTLEGRSTPLRSASEVRAGQALVTTLASGRLRSLVTGGRGAAARAAASADPEPQRSLFDEEDDFERRQE